MASLENNNIEQLLEVVAKLRGKNGCPWDLEQTLKSLKQYLIEETYEVIDAIDSGDPSSLEEELGDVLLQVVLQSQICSEEGAFTFNNVVNRVTDKLIRRHPHVFGNLKVADSKEVLKNWDAIKAGEKTDGIRSLLEGVPKHLPALQKAQRVQSRAARTGFDWTEIKDVIDKIDEELTETRDAVINKNHEAIKEEAGDLLFTIVNMCRFYDINAEEALSYTIDKFTRRFQKMENIINNKGLKLTDCSLAEMDDCWEYVKKEERKSRVLPGSA